MSQRGQVVHGTVVGLLVWILLPVEWNVDQSTGRAILGMDCVRDLLLRVINDREVACKLVLDTMSG